MDPVNQQCDGRWECEYPCRVRIVVGQDCDSYFSGAPQHDAPIKGMGWAAEKQFLVTGSWDKSLRYWDVRSPTAVLTVPMPECVMETSRVGLPLCCVVMVASAPPCRRRVISMDVKYPLLVVATADKKLYVFDLNNPQRFLRELLSPLKLQTRVVKAFHSKRFFAVGSIEGRCAIRAVDDATDQECVEPCSVPVGDCCAYSHALAAAELKQIRARESGSPNGRLPSVATVIKRTYT